MKVFYSRVSTSEQNDERQLQNLKGFDYILSDKCSGSIPLWERPKGKGLKELIDTHQLELLEIHSIDRLGRNMMDVLGVWTELTQKGITIVCRNPSLRNLKDDGKIDKSCLSVHTYTNMNQFYILLFYHLFLNHNLHKNCRKYPIFQIFPSSIFFSLHS